MIGSGSPRLSSTFCDWHASERELAIMRIVVTGASGQLGSYLVDRLKTGSHEIDAWTGATTLGSDGITLRPVELTDRVAVLRALADADPDAIIHAAAISSAEAARRDRVKSQAVNVEATRLLANWAAEHDRRLVYTSTDLVFDGRQSWYKEDDPANAVLVYGQTKHAAERFVVAAPRGLVARLSLLYGPSRSRRQGFFDRVLASLRAGSPQAFFTDEYRTPLDYATAANLLVRLTESETSGTIHLGGPERLSRFELMSRAATALAIDPVLVLPNRRADVDSPEPRPADVSLDSSRLQRVFNDLTCPQVENALAALPPI
jgi:dTDP-4-dehydrorhamnose reductase